MMMLYSILIGMFVGEKKMIMKTKGDKTIVKLGLLFLKIVFFGHMFKNISTLIFGVWSFLSVHVGGNT